MNSNEFTVGSLKVTFPYEPYGCQIDLMANVISAIDNRTNAALESPTGTGKTLSLLCSSLAWLKNHRDSSKYDVCIFYASRTHSQLQQVAREFNKTSYKDQFKVSTLAGRDKLCINEKIMKEANSGLKGTLCKSLTKNQNCEFYTKLHAKSELMVGSCTDAQDIEDLLAFGRKLGQCPYYKAKQMVTNSDLLLVPYQYIFDSYARKSAQINLHGNILIIDEAHNLESIAEDAMSFNFSSKCINLAKNELNVTIKMFNDEQTSNKNKWPNLKGDVNKIENFLESLECQIEDLDSELEKCKNLEYEKSLRGWVYPGMRIYKMLENAGVNIVNYEHICTLIHGICQYLSDQYLALKVDDNSLNKNGRGTKLLSIANFIEKMFHIPNSDVSWYFQLFIEKEKKTNEKEKITFRYFCVSANLAMQAIFKTGVRSIILASGTLAPISHFTCSMGIPFGNIFESNHVAEKKQLVVSTLQQGPDGCELLGTFEKRENYDYKQSIGSLILETSKVTPQGMLTFFPSYTQMNSFIEYWKNNGNPSLWSCIESEKRVFIEPNNSSGFPTLFQEYDRAINGPGAIFFAVCRGKLSEGIDFRDSHCRTVIVVGIPYPPIYDPRLMLKLRHLKDSQQREKALALPDTWYKIQGLRAVNQAVGRVIRHQKDFGAIILADKRYNTLDPNMFPLWLRSSIEREKSAIELMQILKEFFSQNMIK